MAKYSHRNGETEPPAKPGWYFVKKIQPENWTWTGLDMRYVDRISKNRKRRVAYRMDSIGKEYLDDLCQPLQWWGPVTLPWEEGK